MRFTFVTLAAFSMGCSVPDVAVMQLDAAVESSDGSEAGSDAGDAGSDAASDAFEAGCPTPMPSGAVACCGTSWCAGPQCPAKCMMCNCSSDSLCCTKNGVVPPSCLALDAGCP